MTPVLTRRSELELGDILITRFYLKYILHKLHALIFVFLQISPFELPTKRNTKDANGDGNATTWHGFRASSTASCSCCGTTIATPSSTTGTTASTPRPVAGAAAGVATTTAGDFTLGGGGQQLWYLERWKMVYFLLTHGEVAVSYVCLLEGSYT